MLSEWTVEHTQQNVVRVNDFSWADLFQDPSLLSKKIIYLRKHSSSAYLAKWSFLNLVQIIQNQV
jgi:hypothetical protein